MDTSRTCVGTPYCYEQGALKAPDFGTCWWWLRSPGIDAYWATDVGIGVVVDYFGSYVSGDGSAVRPAMWVDASSIPD